MQGSRTATAGRATRGPPTEWMLANDAATVLALDVQQQLEASPPERTVALEDESAGAVAAAPGHRCQRRTKRKPSQRKSR